MNYANLKKIYIVFIVLIILSVLFAIIFLNREISKDEVNNISDSLITILRSEVDKKKSSSLSLAIALAQNRALKDALISENEDDGYEILKSATFMFKKYTYNKSIKIQVITKDFYIFSRSWDNSYAGFPLEDFREDLFEIRKLKKPKVSIEVGRILTFIATVPIVEDGEIIGFLEVIELFDNLVDKFSEIGVDLIVLMNDKFLDKAILMKNNPIIDNFVVANRNYNIHTLNEIKSIEWSEFLSNKIFTKDNKIYIYEPIFNLINQKLGGFILVVNRDRIKSFLNKNISPYINFTYDDIYSIAKVLDSKAKDLNKLDIKQLIYLKDITRDKIDKEAITKELKVRFEELSKDEIINIILDTNRFKKIEGEIR